MPFREITGNNKIENSQTYTSKFPGSLVVDKETYNVYIHDGVTQGGIQIKSAIMQSVTHLTATQLMNAQTAIQLVPAPGAGFMYIVQSVNYNLVFNTTAFGGNDGFQIWYGGLSISADTGDQGVFQGSGSQFQQSQPYSINNGAFPVSLCANQGLFLWNPNGNLSGGDSSGIVTVFYSVVPAG